MARTSDLTIRARVDNSGVTSGLRALYRDLQNAQKQAQATLGRAAVPDLAPAARQAAVQASTTFNTTFAKNIQQGSRQVAAAVETSLKGAAQAAAVLSQEAAIEQPVIRSWQDWADAVRASNAAAREGATAQQALATAEQAVVRETRMSQAEIDRLEAAYQARTAARRQASTVDAATAARAQGLATTQALIQQFEADRARIKDGQARGFLTPAEAQRAGRDAGLEFNRGMIQAIDRASAAGALRGGAGQQVFVQMAGSLKNVDTEARRAGVGIASIRGPLTTLTSQMAATNPAVSQLVSIVGSFALGSTVMIGALAGLAALAAAWRLLSRDAREAKEQQQEARDLLAGLAEQQRIADLGPGGAARDALQRAGLEAERVRLNERLVELQREYTQAVVDATQAAATLSAEQGATVAAAQGRVEDLRRELVDVGTEFSKVGVSIAAGNRNIAEATREAAEATGKTVQDLGAAQARVADIARQAALTRSFQVADPGLLPEGIRESLQQLEALEGQVDSVRNAINELNEAGGAVPDGVLDFLGQLESAAEEAERKLLDMVASILAAFNGLSNLNIQPRISVPGAPPLALPNPNRVAQSDPDAAQRLRVLANAERLAEENQKIIADTSAAINNASDSFLELADALGLTSDELSSAFRAVNSFVDGLRQIQEAGAQSGDAARATEISGLLTIATGIVQLIGSLTGASAVEQENSRILEQNNERLRELRNELSSKRPASDLNRLRGAITDERARPIDTFFSFGGSRERKASRDRIQEIIEAAGISLEEFNRIVEQSGIKLFDENGKLIDGSLVQLREAIDLTVLALTGFANTLSDRQQERDIRNKLQGIEPNAEQQRAAILDDLKALAPELFERFFGNIDLSDMEAVRRATIDMFEAWLVGGAAFAELMGVLTREDFLQIVNSLGDSFRETDKAVRDATSSLRGIPDVFNFTLASLRAAGTREFVPPGTTGGPSRFPSGDPRTPSQDNSVSVGAINVTAPGPSIEDIAGALRNVLTDVMPAQQQRTIPETVTAFKAELERRSLSKGQESRDLARAWPV